MPLYNSAKQKLMDGSIDLDTDTIKVALCTSTYSPDIDTHEDFADITNEVSGTGYTAGGETLANKSVTKDTTDDEGVFDADDVTWLIATITARYAIVYKDTGVSTTSWLICYIDFGSDQSSSASDFTIQWNAEGIVNIT
tara:strand:+ start:12209 stop:12625 length:417 start_codon:yes stop_codon:yes gene_type:complete